MYDILYKRIKNPYILFVISFFIILFSIFLSKGEGVFGGLLSITISLVPLTQIYVSLIEMDEEISERYHKSKNIFHLYRDYIICSFIIFFSGVFAYYIGYILYPEMFFRQTQTIINMKENLSMLMEGNAIYTNNVFTYILINNMFVLLLFFFMSFVFGAGSIYLLLWNSSVIGVFLGIKASSVSSSDILYKYFLYPLYNLILILPHGILEFLSYFLAALAGGIFSIALIKNLDKEILENVIGDSMLLFLISIVLLVLAAIIETFVI